tara:strand:- start:1739 stop:2317 length:579 start_codon:yes stop_codon:yes gene_type:complete
LIASLWCSLDHLAGLLKPMSGNDDFTIGLEQALAWIDVERHAMRGQFEVERGCFFNACAAVGNGNPIYWDDEAAAAITGGPSAPLTMLSAWFRPHYWMPGEDAIPLPWQTHFDLKQTLALPEAVATDSEVVFGALVRPGDRITSVETLRSLSDVKTTRLGRGRFWVIDCLCRNQHGEWVGTETMTGFGYRKA